MSHYWGSRQKERPNLREGGLGSCRPGNVLSERGRLVSAQSTVEFLEQQTLFGKGKEEHAENREKLTLLQESLKSSAERSEYQRLKPGTWGES